MYLKNFKKFNVMCVWFCLMFLGFEFGYFWRKWEEESWDDKVGYKKSDCQWDWAWKLEVQDFGALC